MEEMDDLVQNIAQNIRALRMSRQLTQKEVAKAMGVYESLYVRLEKGTARTSILTIYKAAQFFNVSIDKIVFGREILSDTTEIAYKKQSLLDKMKELEEIDPAEKTMAFKLLDLALSKKQVRELNEIIKSIQGTK